MNLVFGITFLRPQPYLRTLRTNRPSRLSRDQARTTIYSAESHPIPSHPMVKIEMPDLEEVKVSVKDSL